MGQRKCPETGLAVPECSCKRCLEVMLRRFSPDVFAGEIRVTRQRPVSREEPGGHREAA
jgi:hypothetical protein